MVLLRQFPIRFKVFLLLGGSLVAATALYFALTVRNQLSEGAAQLQDSAAQVAKTQALRSEAWFQLKTQSAWEWTSGSPGLAPEVLWIADEKDGGVWESRATALAEGRLARVSASLNGITGNEIPAGLIRWTDPDLGDLWILWKSLESSSNSKKRRVIVLQDKFSDRATELSGFQLSFLSEKDYGQHPLGAALLASQVRSLAQNWESDGSHGGGGTLVGAIARCSDWPGAWIASAPLEKRIDKVKHTVTQSVVVLLLVLTLAVLAAQRFSFRISNPLQRLAAAADQIAAGDVSARVHVKSRDELGNLARAFNSMAEQLASTRTQLVQKGAEVAKEVETQTRQARQETSRMMAEQGQLVETAKLTSLGELAGVTAHEVLNPINNMGIRVTRMKDQGLKGEENDILFGLKLLSEWEKTLSSGGASALFKEWTQKSKVMDGHLLEEDLFNMRQIFSASHERLAQRAKDLEFLEQEMARVSRVVNQMRGLTRVGQTTTEFDIHLAIDRSLASLQGLAEQKSISLIREYSSDLRTEFTVKAGLDELIQVFNNLLKNAVQAVEVAGLRDGAVRVRTRSARGRIEVEVQDNGLGMTAQVKDKLFQTQFTTKSSSEGTGLGLGISRRIARAYGGDVTLLNSQEGRGSVFLVWFPKA